MPRRPRVFVEGLIYHVYNRAGRGEAPFKLEEEADRFWSLLHEVKKRDGLAVLAWCIMPNHYHLAARTASVPLWRSIRFSPARVHAGVQPAVQGAWTVVAGALQGAAEYRGRTLCCACLPTST